MDLPAGTRFELRTPTALYLHIPFCAAKCGYCDFFSVAHAPRSLIDCTVDRSLADLASVFEALASTGRPARVGTLYVGGGTPSYLHPETLHRLLRRINSLLDAPPEEWTLEMNPETVTEERLSAVTSAGVSRLSMGIQSLRSGILGYLDRIATPETNLRALRLLADRYTGRINVDLICGVPGRAPGELEEEIAELLSYHPIDHVSLYTLTVEEGTPLHRAVSKKEKARPDESEQTDEWLAGIEYLESAGYEWYETSNFATPGQRCLHNSAYWRMDPYLGIGPGAVSTLPTSDGPVRITATQALPAPEYRAERLTPEELLLEHYIMGLRTSDGLSRARLLERFGVDPADWAPRTVRCGRDEGLLEVDDTAVRTTRAGRTLLDMLLGRFALELEGREPPRCDWPGP